MAGARALGGEAVLGDRTGYAAGRRGGRRLTRLLGRFFSDRVQALSDLLGDLTWAVVSLAAAVVLGVLVFRRLREPGAN